MGIGSTKKTMEMVLAEEVIRAAFLARDWASRAIAGNRPGVTSVGEGQGVVPPELVRLCKAVDALRTHRKVNARIMRARDNRRGARFIV